MLAQVSPAATWSTRPQGSGSAGKSGSDGMLLCAAAPVRASVTSTSARAAISDISCRQRNTVGSALESLWTLQKPNAVTQRIRPQVNLGRGSFAQDL